MTWLPGGVEFLFDTLGGGDTVRHRIHTLYCLLKHFLFVSITPLLFLLLVFLHLSCPSVFVGPQIRSSTKKQQAVALEYVNRDFVSCFFFSFPGY